MDRLASNSKYDVDRTEEIAAQSLRGRINSLSDVREYAMKLASQMEELADKIAGTQPEKNPGAGPSPVPNSLADHVQIAKENILAQIDRASRAHERISAAVG